MKAASGTAAGLEPRASRACGHGAHRAQSTLEEELEEANVRREEAEQELAELRRRVDHASEPSDAPQEGAGQPRRRSWWREFFGFD